MMTEPLKVQLPDSITLASFNDIPALQISRPECSALVSLFGGQIMTFQPAGERPLLWPNPDLQWSRKHSLRQGSPVCWPWFGSFRRNPATVRDSISALGFDSQTDLSHGPARLIDWQLLEADETPSSSRLLLSLPTGNKLLSVTAEYEFGLTMHCRLTTTNHGYQPVAISKALHSYLAVGDIADITVHGLDSCSYIDALDGWNRKQQSGTVRIDQEVDRIYIDTPVVLAIRDDRWKRTLRVESADSRSSVLWNPWIDKGSALSQFSADSYRSMLCLETARVLDDHPEIQPGEQATLTVRISSRPDK